MQNPRPPAAPASLDLDLDEYYAAAGAMGLLAAQLEEPDPDWAADWSIKFGEMMAEKIRKRRAARRRKA